jgi:hypothetical protein
MSRMEMPERPGLVARFVLWLARRRLGKQPTSLAIVAHHPQIFQGVSGYEWQLSRSRRVPAKLKALAGLKAAALVGCPY